MNTSYFARNGHNPYGVSIAGGCPEWFEGTKYKKLAPKYWFFKLYKENGDKDHYIDCYKREVLDKLDAQTVYNELGCNAILLCWEAPGKFCHRHLVAQWFKEKLGVEVIEL